MNRFHALLELARRDDWEDAAFVRSHFHRKWKLAVAPLLAVMARHPMREVLDDILKALTAVAGTTMDGHMEAMLYFEAISALHEPKVEQIVCMLCTPEAFRRERPPMQRYLRKHYPDLVPAGS